MKSILLLITFLTVTNCSAPEAPAESPATPPSDERKNSPSTPEVKDKPVAKTRSPIFDPANCEFLTEAQIKQVLGDQITDVSVEEAKFVSRSSLKSFTLTLANGNPLKLLYSIAPSSVKSVDKQIVDFTDNAKSIPGLIKMEAAPDGQSYIGTHVSQRRLYVFRSGEETVITLTYDVRGASGGKTPEEVEARRQMGLALIKEVLKE